MTKQKRVKYKNSALREVIFQVRYPSILIISAEAPSAFQELIRAKYPIYSDNRNDTVLNVNGQEQTQTRIHNHQFVTADGFSKVNLTDSFVAVSTLRYDRWEFFKEQCSEIVRLFKQVYNPTVVLRVGLRYKDVITRSKLNLDNVQWSELINGTELGLMAHYPEEKVNLYSLDFEVDDGVVEHRHFEMVREASTPNEKSFLIDCDYYSRQILGIDSVMDIAEVLHDHSSNFIRSVITDKLNAAMEPEEL